MMKPFSGPDFGKNQRHCRGEQMPCAYCGKPIKNKDSAVWVFICCDDFRPTADEERHREHRSNMAFYPLGPDCAKRLKRERPEIFEPKLRGSVLAIAAKALSRQD